MRTRRTDRNTSDEISLDPIITLNAGGVIQSASDSIQGLFGWTPAELFGRNVKVLIPEPRHSALDRYLDRYRHGDQGKSLHRTRRFTAMHKNGRSIAIEMSISRADLPVNHAPYFVGIIRDVRRSIDTSDSGTDRSRLQRLITEQTSALATASLRLQLADRMAALGTLAAGLGHDMNNLLLPARARLNAMEHLDIPPTARAHLAAVRRSLVYLQQMSDGLHHLTLDPDRNDAKPDSSGQTLLNHWWQQVGPLLRKAVPRHVKVTASWPARSTTVAIAPQWLTQAVLNLVVNAGESIPSTRRRPQGLVHISAENALRGRRIRLSVSDNGRGMSHATQRRAFDLFFTTKPRGFGTGLGLPLVRKVALRAGGDVEIKSRPGRGTTVTLVLPMGSSLAPLHPGRGPSTTAVVTVQNGRIGALASHVLQAAGLTVKGAVGVGPGRARFWVTEPTAPALRALSRWRCPRSDRRLIVLGAPSRANRNKWESAGATIVEAADDFETIRDAVAQALMTPKPPAERPS